MTVTFSSGSSPCGAMYTSMESSGILTYYYNDSSVTNPRSTAPQRGKKAGSSRSRLVMLYPTKPSSITRRRKALLCMPKSILRVQMEASLALPFVMLNGKSRPAYCSTGSSTSLVRMMVFPSLLSLPTHRLSLWPWQRPRGSKH